MAGGTVASGGITGDEQLQNGTVGDRRLARSELTRSQILDALIELIGRGPRRPTAEEVARRAGISRRTIFNHFGDFDQVFFAAATLQAHRYRHLVADIPARGPLVVRIRTTCRQRRQLFEAIGPVVGAAYGQSRESARFDAALDEHHRQLRQQLVVTFRPEIASKGSESAYVLDLLELSTDWLTWNMLRIHRGRSPAAAEEMMAFSARSHLS
jgi:AcrR family transcriptional regulator